METKEKEQLKRWFRQYPWLWSITCSWFNVMIRAGRVKGSTKDFVLAIMGDCQYFLYLEGNSGPQVYKSPLNGDGRLANTLLEAAQKEKSVKALAVVKDHPLVPSITIYKPPQKGWNGTFQKALDLLH